MATTGPTAHIPTHQEGERGQHTHSRRGGDTHSASGNGQWESTRHPQNPRHCCHGPTLCSPVTRTRTGGQRGVRDGGEGDAQPIAHRKHRSTQCPLLSHPSSTLTSSVSVPHTGWPRGPSAVRLQKGTTMGHGVTPSPPHPPQGLHEYDDNTVTCPPVPPRDQEDCGDPRHRHPPHDTRHCCPSALHSAHRSLTPCAVMSSTIGSDSSHWGTRPGHGNGTRAPPSPQTATPTRHTAARHAPGSPTCHAGLETLLTADGHPTQGGTDASQAPGKCRSPCENQVTNHSRGRQCGRVHGCRRSWATINTWLHTL